MSFKRNELDESLYKDIYENLKILLDNNSYRISFRF
jgi:hypothetical protein